MKVWVVGVSDCEGNNIRCICTTKQIAERELFKARDELIKEWSEWRDTFYKPLIENLSGNDYEEWDNYPHEVPYLYEIDVLDN